MSRAREPTRTADVEVAVGDVGHQVAQVTGIQRLLDARSDHLVEPAAARGDELPDLVAQDEVARRRAAQDDGHVDVPRQVFEQGSHRRGADPGGHQQHAVGLAGVAREGAVGPLDRHRRARPQVSERGAVLTGRLDRDAHLVAARQGGDGEGVAAPPHALGQEPEVHELATGDRQPLQVVAAHDDRHDAGCLVLDPRHPQAVTEAAYQRQPDPVGEHDAGGQQPESYPVGASQRVSQERRAGGELMAERHGRRQVGVEVDRPPGLVAQVLAHVAIRGHPGQHDQAEAHDRAQHAGEVRHQRGHLVRQPGAHALCIAEGDEQAVGHEEADHPRSQAAMPAHQGVLTDALVRRPGCGRRAAR